MLAASWLAALAILLLGGCASHGNYTLTDRSPVSHQIACRFGEPLGPPTCPRELVYPNGITLADELTEEEAVILALWNNAALLELLTDLGVAQGDLVQAGLLPNPEVVYFFPVSDKPYKYALDFPVEALWLRPIRVAAAEREVERVTQRLTQAGIDLIRDTRQAYADAALAHGRRSVSIDAVKIRGRIASLAKARLDAGDINPQEKATAQIDAHRAEQDFSRTEYDIGIAEERLRNLMGVSADRTPLRLQTASRLYPPAPDIDVLVSEATESRPDALAAAQFSASAAERLRLARIGWVRFLGILDATSGVNGHEFGPAFRTTLPIFNWNQGGISRAGAELERAERQRQTVNNQIIMDVHQSHLRYSQAQAELEILNQRVRPEVETAIRRTELAYREGNIPYVVVLQTTQQLLDSRFREVQLQADLRRAWSDLERSVGRHLDEVQTLEPELIPPPNIPAQPQDAPASQQK
ncbi:TolC family protein [Anatilimnocola floriformis]|uniref:TolC family protein n=1 Tax=Anatilimnocola floriformis TaxID=2948575 RepID=UPI0020C59788|nr:TolC family protein [Anatilimnocola floriformis]